MFRRNQTMNPVGILISPWDSQDLQHKRDLRSLRPDRQVQRVPRVVKLVIPEVKPPALIPVADSTLQPAPEVITEIGTAANPSAEALRSYVQAHKGGRFTVLNCLAGELSTPQS